MKKTIKYILALAASALTLASCQVKEDLYIKGGQDLEGCFGVYFPAQENIGKKIVLDPADPTTITLKAARTLETGAITKVPVTLSSSDEGIFEMTDITFEDGQSETEFQISFDAAEVGKTYTLSITVEDPQYASLYSKNMTAFDFSILREKWIDLGKATLIDNFTFGLEDAETPEYQVDLQQSELKPELFRLINNPYDEGLEAWQATEGFEVNKDVAPEMIYFKLLKKGDKVLEGTPNEVTISGKDLVVFDPFTIGLDYVNGDVKDHILAAHPINVGLGEEGSGHNKVLGYQEGKNLPIAVQFAPFFFIPKISNGMDLTDLDDVITIIFPGAELTDYSISISSDVANEGKLPVTFELGPDVAKVKYAAYEGELEGKEADKKLKGILDGTETNAKELTRESESSVLGVNLEFDKTGIYTLLAVSYDSEGQVQDFDVATVTYLAKGDTDHPVILTNGLSSAKKYIPAGVNPEAALEIYAYGKDLKEVKMGIFDIVEMTDLPTVEKTLLSSEPVSDEDLALINGTGLIDVIDGLLPGTEYVLATYGSNGYEGKIIYSESFKTEGEPKTVYKPFEMEDFLSPLPQKSEEIFGTYNLYSKGIVETEEGEIIVEPLRSFKSVVKISDSAEKDVVTKDETTQKDVTIEFVTVEGIHDYLAKEIGKMTPETFIFSEGLLMPTDNKIETDNAELNKFTWMSCPMSQMGDVFLGNDPGSLNGAPVEDGYLAITTTPVLKSKMGELCWGCVAILNGQLAALGTWQTELLLVKSDKDDSGLAPKPNAGKTHVTNPRFINLLTDTDLLTSAKRVPSIQDAMESALPRMYNHLKGIKGEREVKSTEFKAEFFLPSAKVYKNLRNTKVTDVTQYNF